MNQAGLGGDPDGAAPDAPVAGGGGSQPDREREIAGEFFAGVDDRVQVGEIEARRGDGDGDPFHAAGA